MGNASVTPGLSFGLPNEYGILRPEKWSKNLTYRLMEVTSMMETCNSAFEADLQRGYKVHIPRVPTVPVNAQVEGQPIPHPPIGFTEDIFEINRAWSWGFSITNWSVVQDMIAKGPALVKQVAEDVRVKIERDFLADVYSHAGTGNYGATAGVLSGNINLGVNGTPLVVTTPNDALSLAQAVWQVMQDQNVPDTDEIAFYIPPILWRKLTQSDLKAAYLTGLKESTLISGKLPKIMDNIRFYKSNLLVNDGASSPTYQLPFFHKAGVSYAMQAQNSRILDDPYVSQKLYDCEIIGDWSVVRPELLGWAQVQIVP